MNNFDRKSTKIVIRILVKKGTVSKSIAYIIINLHPRFFQVTLGIEKTDAAVKVSKWRLMESCSASKGPVEHLISSGDKSKYVVVLRSFK